MDPVHTPPFVNILDLKKWLQLVDGVTPLMSTMSKKKYVWKSCVMIFIKIYTKSLIFFDDNSMIVIQITSIIPLIYLTW